MVRLSRVFAAALLVLGASSALAQVPPADNETGNGTDDGGGDLPDEASRPVPIDAQRLLLALGAILVLGFVGFLLFDRFRIADTLILIGFGVLVGPVWRLIDVDLAHAVQPLVSAFALLIIMFDGGLDLDFHDLAASVGWSLWFSFVSFALTVAAVATIAVVLLDADWLIALLLGCALGGTSGMVIMPIVAQLKVPAKVRTGLYVETFVPDLLSVTSVLVLLDVAQARGVRVGDLTGDILAGLSLALVAGVGAGLLWIKALEWLGRRRYAYMVTLAIVLLLAWAVEFLSGSGPLAVLGFGLVLGNRHVLGTWGRVERPKVFTELQSFNNEIAFLVRSAFFALLGITLALDLFTPRFLLVGGALLAALVGSRVVTVFATTRGDPQLWSHRGLFIAMLPRGLTAAVLVSLPAQVGIAGAENFPAYAVVIVVLTNLVLTVGVYLFFRQAARPADDADEGGPATTGSR